MSATDAQRRILWWLIDAGGKLTLITGYRVPTTGWRRKPRERAIGLYAQLQLGLVESKYVRWLGDLRFEITDEGRAAAGTERPPSCEPLLDLLPDDPSTEKPAARRRKA